MIRELPKIDIGGELYFIDLRLNEFRHVDDHMNRINIDHDLFETEDGYVLAFDSVSKTVFRGDREEFEARINKDVTRVQLPSLKEMDPFGFANMVEKWKQDNPLLTAMIEAIPEILHDPLDKRHSQDVENLLPQNEVGKSKGKSL